MKILLRLLLLGAVVLETGCGLPDTFFLQAPTVVTLAPGGSAGQFVFSNPIHDTNHDINVNFTGNELFYKFYSDFNAIEINAYDSTNSSDPSVQLLAKGFHPLCLRTDSPPNYSDPQIAIGTSVAQTGSTVTVTIDSTLASSFSGFVIPSGPSGEIRRNVPDMTSGTTYRTFLLGNNPAGNYTPGTDSDLTGIPTTGINTVYLALYVTSFGFTGASTPQRSVPVYLGYLILSPFP